MKKYSILMLVAVLFAGVIISSAVAQNAGPGPGTTTERTKLTAEQKAQIAEIQRIAREEVEAAQTREEKMEIIQKMRADIEAILSCPQQDQIRQKDRDCADPNLEKPNIERRENCMKQIALSEDQKAEMDAIRLAAMEEAKVAETRRELQNIMEKMHEDLMSVLDPNQIADLQQCREDNRDPNRPTAGNCMDELNLSEEQKATMDAIRLDAMEAADAATSRQERQDIIEKMHEDLMGVLEPNQIAELQQCRQRDRDALRKHFARFDHCLKQLNLSERQIAIIRAIRAEAKKAMMSAKGLKERQQIMRQMQKDIMEILTDRQRARLRECISVPNRAIKQPQLR